VGVLQRESRLETARQNAIQEYNVEGRLENLLRGRIGGPSQDLDPLIPGATGRARAPLDSQKLVPQILETNHQTHFLAAEYAYRGAWLAGNQVDQRSIDLASETMAQPPRKVETNLLEKRWNLLHLNGRSLGPIVAAVEILDRGTGIEEAEIACRAPTNVARVGIIRVIGDPGKVVADRRLAPAPEASLT
jgi:hypothetical protein